MAGTTNLLFEEAGKSYEPMFLKSVKILPDKLFELEVQDWEYTPCPDCGKPMKFMAKLSWEMLDFMEGNCYVEVPG